jgi:hypothetical protein
VNTKNVNSAAGVILAALTQHRTPAGIALALESAGLLMTPETAADMTSVSTDAVGVAERAVAELKREHEANAVLRARVAELEVAQKPSEMYPPALPWAALMDDEALSDFLDDLADAAGTPDTHQGALAEVEATCGRWRLIAEAQHAHNTAPGPDALTRTFAPTQVLREDETQVRGRALLDALTVERAERAHKQRLGIEDPHDSPLHHDYRIGRDLPEPDAAP